MAQIGAQYVQAVQPVPVGTVVYDWPSANIPPGWIASDGQAISRASYPELFSVIGTTFGVGDGSTTFNVPRNAIESDASGRVRKPYNPLFSGSHNGAINVTNVALNSSNCFDTVSYNNGNCFNASTGRFTAPIAGYYYASVHFGTSTNTEINCRIRLNGSSNTGPLAELWNQGGNGAANVMSASIIFCNINDYIDFEAARVNCLAGVQHKRFLVYLLQ